MDDVKDQIVEYLSRKKFITLATSTQNGEPSTHALAYVHIGPTIYVATSKQTRKAKNIKGNPNVAYSIHDETEYLDKIRSIQMEGIATILSDNKESEEAIKMIKHKFSTMADMTSDPDNIVIKITPKICYFVDYTKRFGQRDKVEF